MELTAKLEKNKDIAYRPIESEILAVDPKESLIYILNPVGARVWELIDGTRTAAQIIEMIDGEFQEGDKGCLSDEVAGFVEELKAKGMISTL